jgi:hypothetical protein
MDLAQCFDEDEAIIICDGPKTDARKINTLKKWAKRREFQTKRKTIHIMTWNEFSAWLRELVRVAI